MRFERHRDVAAVEGRQAEWVAGARGRLGGCSTRMLALVLKACKACLKQPGANGVVLRMAGGEGARSVGRGVPSAT